MSSRYRRSLREKIADSVRTRPYLPTKGFPMTGALMRAGYRVPDEVLIRDGRRLEVDLRAELERKQKETAS